MHGRHPAFRLRGYTLRYAPSQDAWRWIAVTAPARAGPPHLAIGPDGVVRGSDAPIPLDPDVLEGLPALE